MSSVALAVSGGALALVSLLLKRASERDADVLREMDRLSPVNLQQLRAAAALGGGGRLLFQGRVDASDGLQPFELQGCKRKSTLAYIRHVVKYQITHNPPPPPKSAAGSGTENAGASQSTAPRVTFEEKELDSTDVGRYAYLVDSHSEQQTPSPQTALALPMPLCRANDLFDQVYTHVQPMASPLAGLHGKLQIGGFSLELGAPPSPSASGTTTQAIALTTMEHCMCAGQTLTVLAQFEMNEDGLLCPRDKDAFIYKGSVNSAQRHLQEKVEQQRTWQYICAASAAPLIALACYQAGSRRSRL